MSEALDVPLYRAGDKIAPDRKLNNLWEEEDDHHWDSHGSRSGRGMAVSVAAEGVSVKSHCSISDSAFPSECPPCFLVCQCCRRRDERCAIDYCQ